jgi:hypothetical protein
MKKHHNNPSPASQPTPMFANTVGYHNSWSEAFPRLCGLNQAPSRARRTAIESRFAASNGNINKQNERKTINEK